MKFKNIFMLLLLLLFIGCGGDILENKSTGNGQSSKIYIVGGLSAQTLNLANTVAGIDVYDPDTDTWTEDLTTIPIPVSFAAVAGYQGKIYIMGGFNTSGTVIPSTQIYDVATNTWSTGADMNYLGIGNSRANHSAIAYNGNIYVLHGTTQTGNAATPWIASGIPLSSLIYTISSDSWATSGATDLAVSNRAAVLIDETIYFLGGKASASAWTNAVDGILISYGSLTSAVTELVLPANRAGLTAAGFTGTNGYKYLVAIGGVTGVITNAGCYAFNSPGGMTTATFTNTVFYLREPFTTPQVAWTSLSNLPASLGYGSSVIVGSTLYYFGGAAYASATTVTAQNVVYSYDLNAFPTGGWTIHDTVMPHSRFGHVAVTVE